MNLTELLPHGYVDAHHHLWAPAGRPDMRYGWLRDIGAPKPFGDPTAIQRDYLIEEFLAEAPMAPCASVHVQADGALMADPVSETAFVAEEAARAGHRIRIVGLAALDDPDLPAVLDGHGAYDAFCGVRQIVARLEHRTDLNFAERALLRDPNWIAGLRVLEDRGLSFDLQMYPEQAEQALEALVSTPALTVIIDHGLCPYHMSLPPEDSDFKHETETGHARWLQAVRVMATRPNTYVKLSGWGMYAPGWSQARAQLIEPHISDLLREFGPERVMWGSNHPVEKLATSYADALMHVADKLPQQQRQDVFLRTAAKAYGLTLT